MPYFCVFYSETNFKVLRIRARACIKCREYVIIQPNDPENQELIKIFEASHRGHTLITLDFDEVKGQYKEFQIPK